MSTRIAILGHGRMGQEIRSCIAEADDLQVSGICVRGGPVDSGAAHWLLGQAPGLYGLQESLIDTKSKDKTRLGNLSKLRAE